MLGYFCDLANGGELTINGRFLFPEAVLAAATFDAEQAFNLGGGDAKQEISLWRCGRHGLRVHRVRGTRARSRR